MDNHENITQSEQISPPYLWQQLENINNSSVEELIKTLMKYVSKGFFSAAAELSDSLESYPGLDENPNWKVKVELERMKRYYCLGFKNLTIASSNRVLNHLRRAKVADNDELLLCKGTAIGHKGWLTSDTDELQNIINSCSDIRDEVQNQKDRDERTCFIYALNGRLLHLQKEYPKANQYFEKAIEMAETEQNRFLHPAAHIKIIYAEHLALQEEWEKVVAYANEFLLNAAQLQFKTHLLIRVFVLVLQAPNKYLKNQEKDFQHYAFRYQILLHAMGLSQSQELNPILAKAKKLIPEKEFIDFYYVDWRTELRRRILEIADDTTDKKGRKFERLIMLYYKKREYTVFDLPPNSEAIDFVAMHTSPDGVSTFIAVQVKSGKNSIKKDDIIGYCGKLLTAKTYLESGVNTDGNKIKQVSLFHWYSIKSIGVYAHQELEKTVKICLGDGCKFKGFNLDEIVDLLLYQTEALIETLFSKALDTE